MAQDHADWIADAVAAASRLGAAVFVVSDGSADPTADLACEHGAEVVETLRPLGLERAVRAGAESFRLAERYAFVRDVNTITQHFLVRLDTLTTAGAILAGQELELPIF